MAFDNLDLNSDLEQPEAPPPEESSNRMFLIAAGILGAIALLALICIAVYAMVLLPQRRGAQAQQKATLDAQNTEVAYIIANTATSAALTAIQASYTETPTMTPVPDTATPIATPTAVVVFGTATEVLSPEMATAVALAPKLTANAILFSQTLTARPPLATTPVVKAIPDTGFADNIGLPSMVGLAVLLLAVMFLARRLRAA
jgi:hypothetical protein